MSIFGFRNYTFIFVFLICWRKTKFFTLESILFHFIILLFRLIVFQIPNIIFIIIQRVLVIKKVSFKIFLRLNFLLINYVWINFFEWVIILLRPILLLTMNSHHIFYLITIVLYFVNLLLFLNFFLLLTD